MIFLFIIIFILYIAASLIYELNSHQCEECKKWIWNLKPMRIYEPDKEGFPVCVGTIYLCNQCKIYREEE
jgi:hypothetical protein